MFVCTKCGHTFRKQQGLTRHLARTTPCDGALPYKCDRCGRGFTRADNLQRHEKTCGQATRKQTVDDAVAIAASRGGLCLSEKYIDCSAPMKWRCAEGHEWAAPLKNVKNRQSWCPACANARKSSLSSTKLSILDAQKAAAKHGGECLSKEYANIFAPLRWRCVKGHEWGAPLNRIRNIGTWCPTCAPAQGGNANPAKLSIRDAQKIAFVRGGSCLSEEYANAITPLLWRCAEGHEWHAPLNGVRNGNNWCPYCPNRSESETRKIFELFTGRRFPKQKGLVKQNPKWELDGYCKELGVAFEYHGIQHYEFVEHFHRNGLADLEKQQARDKAVEDAVIMLEEPIALIIVPYWLSGKPRVDFIWDQLSILGVVDD